MSTVELNDPRIRFKDEVTLGITALFFLRVLIEKKVCDLDVELKCLFNCRS